MVQPDSPGHTLTCGTLLRLHDIQRETRLIPALQGLVTDFLATRGDGVSYGFAVAPSDRSYAYMNRDQYELTPGEAKADSFVIPFLFSSSQGLIMLFRREAEPHQAWEYKRYLMIGDGDVGSIRNEFYEIRNIKTASFSGEVRMLRVARLSTTGWCMFTMRKSVLFRRWIFLQWSFCGQSSHGDYYWIGPRPDPFPSDGERFSDF